MATDTHTDNNRSSTAKTRGGFTHESTNANSVEWYTPAHIFQALTDEHGETLRFDLDVASPGLDQAHVPAACAYTKQDDGLAQQWHGRVWCNPPYTRGLIDAFLERMANHANGIALVFARTDTQWWQNYAATADVVCFIEGRIKFESPDRQKTQAATAPSVLLAWGEASARAVANSGLGRVAWHNAAMAAKLVADAAPGQPQPPSAERGADASAFRTPREQVDVERILKLDERDEVSPPVTVEQRADRGVVHVCVGRDLPEAVPIDRVPQTTRDLLGDFRSRRPVETSIGPPSRHEETLRRSRNSPAARHPATVAPSPTPTCHTCLLPFGASKHHRVEEVRRKKRDASASTEVR